MSGIDDDDEMGAPIDFSALLEVEQSVDADRLAARIERRQVGADLTTFFWVTPAEVLRGFLQGMFGAPTGAKDEDNDG